MTHYSQITGPTSTSAATVGRIVKPEKMKKKMNGSVNEPTGQAAMAVVVLQEVVEQKQQEQEESAGQSPQQDLKTEEQIKEEKRRLRRERNRQAAAASRERKKQYIKSLEDSVAELKKDNERLTQELSILRSYVEFIQPYLPRIEHHPQLIVEGKITAPMIRALQRIEELRKGQ